MLNVICYFQLMGIPPGREGRANLIGFFRESSLHSVSLFSQDIIDGFAFLLLSVDGMTRKEKTFHVKIEKNCSGDILIECLRTWRPAFRGSVVGV